MTNIPPMGRAFITAVSILGALTVSTAAHVPLAAQEPYDPPGAAQAERLSPRALDALLAPIALYPDQLLAPILMAATYPHDVEEAANWTSVSVNASLRGDGLAFALEGREWDPSVKTLAQFPDVLRMLNDEWDWMVRVGNAFLLQETEVMDSVQRLRHQAYAAGELRSTDLQRVRFDNGAVVIDMIDPATVYIPRYDPVRAYGFWAYPDYPPYYFARPVIVNRYYVVPALWGWSSWEWSRHRIRVDMPRYRYFGRNNPWRFNDDTWRHDRGRGRGSINYRRDDRPGYDRGRDNDRRGSDWRDNDRRDNDGRDNDRRDWNGVDRGPRDNGGGRANDGRNDRRDNRPGEQRVDRTPPTAPVGAFRGDPSEVRRQFGQHRPSQERARGVAPGQNDPSQQEAAAEQMRRQMRGEGGENPRRFGGEGRNREDRAGRPDRQSLSAPGQNNQAWAGPQLTPPTPITPMAPQPPRVREQREPSNEPGEVGEQRRQFGGNAAGAGERFRGRQPDASAPANPGGNREFRRGGGNGGDGDGERRGGNGRGRDRNGG